MVAPKAVPSGAGKSGWILLLFVCALAFVPGIGLTAWIIGGPILVASFVLSIVAMSRGETLRGVALMLFSLTIAPAVIVFAPMLGVAVIEAWNNPAQARQNIANARAQEQAERAGRADEARREAGEAAANSTPVSLRLETPVATPLPTPAFPRHAKLAQPISVKAQYGTVQVPAGSAVRVLGTSGTGFVVEAAGQRTVVPAASLAP